MTLLAILAALLLVLLNGFFVAAEFALVKVRETRIVELADAGSRRAKMAMHAIHHLDAYLSATQLGITLASLGLGWIGEPAFARVLDPLFSRMGMPESVAHGAAFALAFATISVLHIVLGELAPKSWAIQKPDTLSLWVAFPLHWFYRMFMPAIVVLNGLANRILRLFGIQPASDHEMAHSEEELSMILAASGESGVLKKSEVDIVEQVFRFGDLNVTDVMVPRTDMSLVSGSATVAQALHDVLRDRYSRYPVFGEDTDDILGWVHLRDLLTASDPETTTVASIARKQLTVPPNKSLDMMLRDFQSHRVHLAIVMDEYGGTQGLVTLEDVLEEIVGEIDDETDVAEAEIRQTGANRWEVLGKTHLLRLQQALGTPFSDTENDTLGGHVFGLAGRIPKEGETFRAGEWTIKVLKVENRRLKLMELTRDSD